MKEIKQFATEFRRAIDLVLEAGEFDNDSIYCRFPHGVSNVSHTPHIRHGNQTVSGNLCIFYRQRTNP